MNSTNSLAMNGIAEKMLVITIEPQ